MKLKKWELALIMALGVTLLTGAGLGREQRALSDKLIRLHVVAGSDSREDQALKLCVRDRIVAYLTGELAGVTERGEAMRMIAQRLDAIAQAAQEELVRRGSADKVTVSLTREDFPTRVYDTFSLPAGGYEALRVVIGDGGGQNWWCVVFPPLCGAAAAGELGASYDLTDEEVRLITSDGPQYVIRFKTMEIFEKLKNWLGL